jgi:hypothetical protein
MLVAAARARVHGRFRITREQEGHRIAVTVPCSGERTSARAPDWPWPVRVLVEGMLEAAGYHELRIRFMATPDGKSHILTVIVPWPEYVDQRELKRRARER